MFAQGAPITIPPMVSVFTKGIGWVGENISASAPTSSNSIGTTAIYHPILLPSTAIIKRVWWANGASVSGSTTLEVGIYADSGSFSPGAKLVSGSATQGTANQVQFVDVTDISLPPGLYWIASVASATTDIMRGAVESFGMMNAVRLHQTSGYPLPSTATPVETNSTTHVLSGFSTTSGTTDIPAPPSMWARPAPITIPPMVSVFTKGLGWVGEDISAAAPVSTAFEGSNRAVYYPLPLPSSCVVKRVWWVNGTDVVGGATIECGIYADSGAYSPGAKLISGSATQGTASEVQFVDVTDTALPPGPYWVAITASSGTNTTLFQSAIQGTTQIDALSRFQQASALPLPATATPAESGNTAIWLCGFSTTASP